MSNSFVLIDAKNALFRHQHVHNFLATEEGFPTGAVYGCLNVMLSFHKRLPEAGIVWCWDGMGETWRHKYMANLPQLDSLKFKEPEEASDDEVDTYADEMVRKSLSYLGINNEEPIIKDKKPKKRGYKAQRHRPELEKKKHKSKWPETPRERALLQIPVLKMMLNGLGIRSFEVECLECDDLLAMVAKRIMKLDKHAKIYIYSGDRDYYQLLKYKNIVIATGFKDGKLGLIKRKDVEKQYGVKPRHWARFRALTGDSSDNIPHLANIGSVRAKQMLADGLNPKIPKLDDVPQEAQVKYAKYFSQGIEKMWGALHGNYKLCKLVTDPSDEVLSSELRERLGTMFDRFTSLKRFYRSSSKKDAEAYRRTTFVLSQYAMKSILMQRDKLFEIP